MFVRIQFFRILCGFQLGIIYKPIVGCINHDCLPMNRAGKTNK